MEPRSFLDTHVLVWLLANELDRLSSRARDVISASDELRCSPMVRLELQFMHEIGRLDYPPNEVMAEASRQLGISVEDRSFEEIVIRAQTMTWTRDPFDRLITAQAALQDAPLVTKDRRIRDNYAGAVW